MNTAGQVPVRSYSACDRIPKSCASIRSTKLPVEREEEWAWSSPFLARKICVEDHLAAERESIFFQGVAPGGLTFLK